MPSTAVMRPNRRVSPFASIISLDTLGTREGNAGARLGRSEVNLGPDLLSGALIALALALAAWLFVSPARAEVVDRVVASVGEQLVTDSETRLEAVISALDRSPSPFWDRDRRPPLDRLIDAAVVRELAGDVSLYQPPGDALAARVEALRVLFPDRSAWQQFLDSWGLDEEDLRTVLLRRMVVERYLARNVQAPTDEPAAWWDAYEALLSQQRSRFRIRVVPPIAEGR